MVMLARAVATVLSSLACDRRPCAVTDSAGPDGVIGLTKRSSHAQTQQVAAIAVQLDIADLLSQIRIEPHCLERLK